MSKLRDDKYPTVT